MTLHLLFSILSELKTNSDISTGGHHLVLRLYLLMACWKGESFQSDPCRLSVRWRMWVRGTLVMVWQNFMSCSFCLRLPLVPSLDKALSVPCLYSWFLYVWFHELPTELCVWDTLSTSPFLALLSSVSWSPCSAAPSKHFPAVFMKELGQPDPKLPLLPCQHKRVHEVTLVRPRKCCVLWQNLAHHFGIMLFGFCH